MNMKRFLPFLFCLMIFPVFGSHIVGGEFEIKYISGNKYRVRMIIYFDELNGNPGAKDLAVDVRIFRKHDNFIMRTLNLPIVSQENVNYTQPECSNGKLVTSKLVYEAEVTMTPNEFDDAQGYYLSWERCCRNYSITNVYSQDPAVGNLYAGQTFYLEFPAVVQNDEPFINSSPRLFPPLSDYACPNKLYYVDFGGIDDDGDSLVYTLVTPLNTLSPDALPPGGFPRPQGPSGYPNVSFRPPYGPNNYIGGQPDLKISDDGFLTVTPTVQGLFVFAVKCEEFRDRKKIGELRRDFQMLVVDDCSVAEPPQILGKAAADASFVHDETMTISFSNTVSDEDRCIQVEVSDLDSSRPQDSFTEKVKIRAIPIGFKKDLSSILPGVTTAVLQNGSKKVFDICFDKCPPFENGTFQIGIVAYDDACSLPLSDTLKITVNVQPPTNTKPYFTTANVAETVMEGDARTYQIRAVDDENNQMAWFMLTDQFILAKAGMSLVEKTSEPGLFEAELVWDPRCDVYDFTAKQNFEVKILVEDLDECNFPKLDTMIFKLAIDLPGNSDPLISTSLTPDEIQNGVKRRNFESLDFTVTGHDSDDDFIMLSGNGVDFQFANYGMTFPSVSGTGATPRTSTFHWDLTCANANVNVKDEFDLRFIVVDDANKCRFYKADTLDVKVFVTPPNNTKPTLTVTNTNPELAFISNHQTVVLGQQISLALTATDQDVVPSPDEIKIELIDVDGTAEPAGYVFEPVSGFSSINTTFAWKPECSLFENNVWTNDYTFTFRTLDDRCFNAKVDTVEVKFTIKDIEVDEIEFQPPNFVSPNNDSDNDFFAMVKLVGGELVSIIPPDNCTGRFLNIVVYNRWGLEVFKSIDRNFRWYPEDEAAGIYFYTMKFSDREYKGSVTVMY